MRETSRKWMQAALEKLRDIKATVACPICGKGVIEIEDILVNSQPSERRIFCTNCDAVSYARISPVADETETSPDIPNFRPTKH